MNWLEIAARTVILTGGWGVVIYIVASILAQDPEDDDAWDRGHDQWVDEQTGVTP